MQGYALEKQARWYYGVSAPVRAPDQATRVAGPRYRRNLLGKLMELDADKHLCSNRIREPDDMSAPDRKCTNFLLNDALLCSRRDSEAGR